MTESEDRRQTVPNSDRTIEFAFGISRESLVRWEAFKRIRNLQAKRGAEVGASLMRFVVDEELAAIMWATAVDDQRGERHPAEPA